MRFFKPLLPIFLLIFITFTLGCDSTPPIGDEGEGGGESSTNPVDPPPSGLLMVAFNPLGAFLAFNLIDLEFLPGQNGDLLVIAKDGTVFYLDGNFNLIASNNVLAAMVIDDGERGLLNVAADPDYANNQMVYFYYTYNNGNPNDGADDVNRVERRWVDIDKNAGTLGLSGDTRIIIEFAKSESPNPGNNHNGGGMAFDPLGNLIIGVGDGGGGGSADTNLEISQDPSVSLGKIHRIVPNTGNGGVPFSLPTLPSDDLNQNNPSGPDSIYVYGVRNPFTITGKDKGDQLFGDVGSSVFEELNCLYHAGENYGWPHHEGFSGLPNFVPAAHGYAHGDETFSSQDPLATPGGPLSIMVVAFIEGDNAYNGVFERRAIYAEFFQGWVRALRVEEDHVKSADDHIGHLEGLTSLQKNPVDGFYYAVSLGGSNQVLRMELAP